MAKEVKKENVVKVAEKINENKKMEEKIMEKKEEEKIDFNQVDFLAEDVSLQMVYMALGSGTLSETKRKQAVQAIGVKSSDSDIRVLADTQRSEKEKDLARIDDLKRSFLDSIGSFISDNGKELSILKTRLALKAGDGEEKTSFTAFSQGKKFSYDKRTFYVQTALVVSDYMDNKAERKAQKIAEAVAAAKEKERIAAKKRQEIIDLAFAE